MRLAGFFLLAGLIGAGSMAGAAPMADPPDMAAQAKELAQAAPDALSRRTLGQIALPSYATAKFRNVRGHYRRQELVNDQVIFCGELDADIPDVNRRSGWTKFAYFPGDPTTLITTTPGLGIREIGPKVYPTLCETGKEVWLSPDYTADFNKRP